MSDLLVVFIGLAVIFYIFFVLGTSRLAIAKNFSEPVLWFLFSLILPPVAFVIVFQMSEKPKKEEHEKGFFENTILELTQPFIDLAHTSKALLGVNLSYVLEGLTYFGVVGLLAIFFNDFIGLNDVDAGIMVGILTSGITIAMLFLGATVDWIGLRKALLIALSLMLVGRVLLTTSPGFGETGFGNPAHIIAMLGILGVILGYGIYQPACYAGVKQLTNAKTAAMGYAMLYSLMNLGGFLPAIISPPVRKAYEITGVFWVYATLTLLGILVVLFFVTNKAMKSAVNEIRVANGDATLEEEKDELAEMSAKERLKFYLKNFPLKDLRFLFFIFILIPVQTLFAHNWLTLPQYTSRAFEGFVGDNFEFFVNLNPILIFILTPMVTALTVKKDTYKMMIIGTAVMASPTFILVMGPNIYTLLGYLLIMTIGESMWQPRFLQWVAEIAPKNMTGIYMGIGQFPWFLTKFVTSLYSGWFLMNYIPDNVTPAETNSEMLWLIYGFIAIITPVALFLAKGWMQKGFKTKHEG